MAATTYTTESGDTWDLISLRVYDDERYMGLLIEANPDYRYKARLLSGIVLTVPELPTPTPPSSLPPWRR